MNLKLDAPFGQRKEIALTAWTQRPRGVLLALLMALPLTSAYAQPASTAAWTVRPEMVKADVDTRRRRAAGTGERDGGRGEGGGVGRGAVRAIRAGAGAGDEQLSADGDDRSAEARRRAGAQRRGPGLAGLTLLMAPAGEVRGRLAVATSNDPAALPAAT